MKPYTRFGWTYFFMVGFGMGILGCSGGSEQVVPNQDTGQNDDDDDNHNGNDGGKDNSGGNSENGGSGGNGPENLAGAGGSGGDVPLDEDGDGYKSDMDCNDGDAKIFPGAVELANGLDDNCNGTIDEGTANFDDDGDGFTENQGDCDDSTGAIKPGADDSAGDIVDSDCGGTYGPDPYVKKDCASPGDGHCFAKIQDALDAVVSDPTDPKDSEYLHQTVWVFPGTYEEYEVSPGGKAFHLKSTHGASQTIVDAKQQGSVMVIEDGETLDTIMDGLTLTNGAANWDGGGIYLEESSPTLKNLVIQNNSANGYVGGGIAGWSSSPLLENVLIRGNTAEWYGGGIYFYNSKAVLHNVSIFNNSDLYDVGGGIYLEDSSPALTNVLIAFNGPYNLYSDSSSTLTIQYSNIYNPEGFTNISDNIVLDDTNLSVDPGFVRYSNDGDSSNDILHLLPNSQLIHAGDPTILNPDGSRSDMGADGGPLADRSYYTDGDQDGMYDVWEKDENLTDANADADGDGLNNKDEFLKGAYPNQPDSDGDGLNDGTEVQTGTTLNDWYSQEVDEVATAHVPGDFDTIQEAINAIRTEGIIQLGSQTYTENLQIFQKNVHLVGAGEEETILSGGDLDSVIKVADAIVDFSGFTVTEGNAMIYGGGILLNFSTGKMQDIAVSGNSSSYAGGGMYLSYSSPTMTNVTVSGNIAQGDGGGMWLYRSNPTLTNVVVSDNSATATTGSSYGGGMYLESSNPSLNNVTISGNTAKDDGGGMELYDSSPTLTNVTVSYNSSGNYGGGIDFWTNSFSKMTNVSLTNNSAVKGGGMNLHSSNPTLANVALSDNSATYGGGMYLSSSNPEIKNSIIAYNTGYNVYLSGTNSPSFRYSDVYNVDISTNFYPSTPTTGFDSQINKQIEPGFLDYRSSSGASCTPGTTNCTPMDFHLLGTSQLKNAGDTSTNYNDPDNSRNDMGIYGGPEADSWDMDGDGCPDYYWPGGYDSTSKPTNWNTFDKDDSDANVGCE